VIPPLARECVLHGITVFPLGEEFGRDAAQYFSDQAWGQQLTAKVGCRRAVRARACTPSLVKGAVKGGGAVASHGAMG
jgi:hypothetical protein